MTALVIRPFRPGVQTTLGFGIRTDRPRFSDCGIVDGRARAARAGQEYRPGVGCPWASGLPSCPGASGGIPFGPSASLFPARWASLASLYLGSSRFFGSSRSSLRITLGSWVPPGLIWPYVLCFPALMPLGFRWASLRGFPSASPFPGGFPGRAATGAQDKA